MAGFTKLDSNIVDSSIWGEPYHRRIMWITFLAKKDHAGIVRASVSGMQRAANVTLEEAQDSIKCLESPDPDSRTPDNEGRRIQKIEGGWLVLNHKKYRDFSYSTSPEAIRQRKHREKQPVTGRDMSRTPRDISASVSVSASEGGAGGNVFAETPSWEEFWAYCKSVHCGIAAEWFAKDKYWAASQDRWKGRSDWRAYARRVRGWWDNDGRPMTPPNKNGISSAKPIHHLRDSTYDASKEENE